MLKFCLFFAFFCSLSPAAAAQAQFPSLRVMVIGAQPAAGPLEVTLFDSAESFMREPFRQQSGQVSEAGEFVAFFDDLPLGEYAAVVVHDENDNGRLDSGFLGMGSEPYGFSNGADTWFGWPSFEDAKFTVEAPTEITIDLD
ncbi:MAG: DUF2141 domain-containing protein [Xanthomonadales bacterium]|nr:DUF2141 domain-containing protein [Xanthomonadales bacterium]